MKVYLFAKRSSSSSSQMDREISENTTFLSWWRKHDIAFTQDNSDYSFNLSSYFLLSL